MNEAGLMREIQLYWSNLGHRLFRNNVGHAQTKDGRYITFGLAPGSSDLIGFKRVKITQDMVGKTIAVFSAIEVKGPRGRATTEQVDFLATVTNLGGHAKLAYSVEDSL